MATPVAVWSTPFGGGNIQVQQGSLTNTGIPCTEDWCRFFVEDYEIIQSRMLASVYVLGSPKYMSISYNSLSMPNDLPIVPYGVDPLGFTFDMEVEAYACFDGVEKKALETVGYFWVPTQEPTFERNCDGTCLVTITIPRSYYVKRVVVKATQLPDGDVTLYDSGELLNFKEGSTTVLDFAEVSFEVEGIFEEHLRGYLSVTQYIDTNPNSVGGTTRVQTNRTLSYLYESCGVAIRDCDFEILAPIIEDVGPVSCEGDVQPPAPPPPETEIPEPLPYFGRGYRKGVQELFDEPSLTDFGVDDHLTAGTSSHASIPGIVSLDASFTGILDYGAICVFPEGTSIYTSLAQILFIGGNSNITLVNQATIEYSPDQAQWTSLAVFAPVTTYLLESIEDRVLVTEEDIEARFIRLTGDFRISGLATPPASSLLSIEARLYSLQVVAP